ncbi:translation initiation factor aIF-1A [Natronomonas pharaonis DSM 2160]|uniref:Translation initiation factor 1A n=1 Tax=Natronomonas pharaonis (strain ATCC 35678 / DSM 2160 / CIP 103997 / JCM 8858 / NBRC 14720 / NCIMB 2260 / Gabara) TaxID=348780 RepID=A0A1U7ETM5_NATPD|nr:translation initiation factor eIF-1A [Natronomonas pharaonis]CAI48258.2 translation initiation factor aIF-1A [Natronomonas pharaonis DSM 2160]
MTEETQRKDLRMPDDSEMFATVTEMLGGQRVRLQCNDGKERMGRIPGRMRFRTWINKDDVVLIEPWDWQDEKADIEWRYEEADANQLRREGHIK